MDQKQSIRSFFIKKNSSSPVPTMQRWKSGTDDLIPVAAAAALNEFESNQLVAEPLRDDIGIEEEGEVETVEVK